MKDRLIYLFRQYTNNTASHAEMEEFLAYVKQARNDGQVRLLIREVYNGLSSEQPVLSSFIDEQGTLVLTEPAMADPGQQPAKKRKTALAGLSLLVIVLTGALLWWRQTAIVPARQEASIQSLTRKITGASEQKLVTLPDGTRIWLNENSYIEFPDEFAGNKREIFLSGEAWFDVKHAAESPFIIHAANIVTTVLGTSFDIKAYSYQHTFSIAVGTGKVRVGRESTDAKATILQVGQKIKFDGNGDNFTETSIDTSKIAAWQQGNLSYDDEELGDIIQDLIHLYNVQIIVKDRSLLHLKITTSLRRSIGVRQALDIIAHLVDRRIDAQNDGRFVIE